LTRIGFKADASESWDIEFDAHKKYGASSAPQLWTVSDNELFAQNFLPFSQKPVQIPLYYRAGTNSVQYIEIEGLSSFYNDCNIFLEDLFTNEIIDLREDQSYVFSASTDDVESRFVLHFHSVTTIENNTDSDNIIVYSDGRTIYIKTDTPIGDVVDFDIISLTGQRIYSGSTTTNTLNGFELNETTGIYLVRVKTKEASLVKKVFIN